MRLETEKEKNRLVNLSIEEERSLRAQYKTQADDEREARKVAESNMREYQNRANALRDQVSIVQSKLEFQKKELKKLKEQNLKSKKELR